MITSEPFNTHPLTVAIESVFEIRFDQYDIGGTAFIVGRQREGDGFVYNAITAAHCVDSLMAMIVADPDVSTSTHISFNSWAYGKYETDVDIDIKFMNPDLDWAVISFRLQREIPCLKLAGQDRLNQLSPADPVFQMGAEDLEGVLIHRTNIAAMTFIFPTPDEDQFKQSMSPLACCRFPLAYLRTGFATIPGASGGPLLDINGNVLGIITARWNCTSVVLKAGIILAQAGGSDFFVEEK